MTIKEFINPARIFIKTKEGKGTTLDKYLRKISEDVYSSEEVKTNKIWVDENGNKKPIYRKIIKGTIPNKTNSWADIIKFSDSIDVLCPTTCGNLKTSSNADTPMPKYESASYNISYQVVNGLFMVLQNGYSGRPFKMVFEYTKTTD